MKDQTKQKLKWKYTRLKNVNEFWKIAVVLTIGITWTYNTIEFKSLMADHARALQVYERVIEQRHATVVENSEDTEQYVSDDEGAVVDESIDTEVENTENDTSLPVEQQIEGISFIEDKIKNTFPEQADIMLAIAKAENRNLLANPTPNHNSDGSIDCGLMQINSIHGYTCEYLENIDNNLEVARYVYDTQGITAWSTYNSGKYLEYLHL